MSLLKKILSFIPTQIPTGRTEFEAWTQSIIDLTGPIANKKDMAFVIAVEVMHSNPHKSYLPKNFFVNRLRKVAANQIAAGICNEVKEAQEAARLKAEATAKLQESTVANVLSTSQAN